MKKLCLLVSFFCLSCLAHADLVDSIGGDYKGKGEGLITLKLSVNKASGKVKADARVTGFHTKGEAPCEGNVDATGKLSGNVLTLTKNPEKDYTPSFGKCILTVKFDSTGNNATLAKIEEEHCLDWHGSSCAFNGKLAKVK